MNDPDWDNYNQFNSYRSSLIDRSFPDYDTNLDLYSELKMSNDDITLFKTWDYADPNIFNIESTKKLFEAKNPPDLSYDYWDGFIESFSTGYFTYDWSLAVLISALILIYSNRKNYIWFLIIITELFLYSAYFYYFGRFLLNRVDICVFISITVSFLFIFLDSTDIPVSFSKKQLTGIIFLIIMLFVPVYAKHIKKYYHESEVSKQHREISDPL